MKNILVPVDFSKSSLNALDYACNLAKDYNANIVILNAYDVFVPVNEIPAFVPPVRELEEKNLKLLKDLCESNAEKFGIALSYVSIPGSLISSLKDTVKTNHTDLIIMGMRGNSETLKHILGSNTYNVIDEGVGPVLAIPEGISYKKPTNIAFAADLHEVAPDSFIMLKDIVSKFNAKIHVVKVVAKEEMVPANDEAIAGVHIEHMLEGMSHEFHFPESYDVITGLDRFLKIKKPDMLMMIPRKHNFFIKMFKEGNTEKMIYHTHVPLLALPDKINL